MKGMILAAGKGTRVRPITHIVPKPMIPLIRKPVMEYIIDHLRGQGVDEIIVNTSHLAPLIEDYFRDGERFGVQIAYSFEGEMVEGDLRGKAVGSAGGMKRVQDFSGFFDETFIVLCGDALIDLNIREAVAFHRKKNSLATIILRDIPRSEVYKYGVVKLNDDGRVTAFQEKPKVDEAVSNTINTGIYIFEPEVFSCIPSGQEYDIGGNLLPTLVSEGFPVYGLTLPFQWVDIGSVSDYWEASRLLLTGQVKGYPIPGREIAPGIHAGINLSLDLKSVTITPPVYIGSSSSVGKGAEIHGPTVIGSNCSIEAGAIIRESLVNDYTRVSGIAHLERMIVFGNKCIDPEGSVLDIGESDIGWVVDDVRKKAELTDTHLMLMEMARHERSGR